MLWLWLLGWGELILLVSHRGRFDLHNPALGNRYIAALGVFIVVVGAFKVRFAIGGHLHAVAEFHHVLARTSTQHHGENYKAKCSVHLLKSDPAL